MASPTNTEFAYLYRDNSNFKSYGGVVFAGKFNAELLARLKNALGNEVFFVAAQLGVPAVDFVTLGKYSPNADDHPWHEFEGLTETDQPPTDERSFEEFVAKVELVARDGWKAIVDGYRIELNELQAP